MERVLLVVAMQSEADVLASTSTARAVRDVAGAVVREGRIGGLDVMIVQASVGPVAAAVATTSVLAHDQGFDAVMSTGIAGAFVGSGLAIGDLVVSSTIVDADLGMETDAGFATAMSRGWPAGRVDCLPELVDTVSATMPASVCEILTVSRLSAAPDRIADLTTTFPDAEVEAMEGIGVAFAAASYDIPALEVRAISNVVGPIETCPWDPEAALGALAEGFNRLGASVSPQSKRVGS